MEKCLKSSLAVDDEDSPAPTKSTTPIYSESFSPSTNEIRDFGNKQLSRPATNQSPMPIALYATATSLDLHVLEFELLYMLINVGNDRKSLPELDS